jgi:hypothetical protein
MSIRAKANGVVIQPVVVDYYDATENNSSKTWTVPDGVQWRLLRAHVIYVSSSDAGNRQIVVEVKNASGNILDHLVSGTTQAASLTRHYTFLQGIYRETAFAGDELQVPIPIDMYLQSGYVLTFKDDAAIAASADDMTVAFGIEVT